MPYLGAIFIFIILLINVNNCFIQLTLLVKCVNGTNKYSCIVDNVFNWVFGSKIVMHL